MSHVVAVKLSNEEYAVFLKRLEENGYNPRRGAGNFIRRSLGFAEVENYGRKSHSKP